jgi:hypothetical protein
VLRESLKKLLGKSGGPDSSRNTGSDTSSNGGEQSNESKDSSNVLVRRSSHDSKLLTDNKSTSSKGNEDLAHNDVSDGGVGLAEVDHKTGGHDVERNGEEQSKVLELASPLNEETDNDCEEAGSDGVNVVDVSSVTDGLVVNNLDVRGVVGVPTVERDEDGARKSTGSENGTVGEELERNEGLASEVLLVETESDERNTSDDEHGDDGSRSPGLLLVVGEREGKKDKDESSTAEDDSNEVELPEVVGGELRNGLSDMVRVLLNEALLLGLNLVLEDNGEEGNTHDRENDGPNSVSPLPGGLLVKALSEGRSCEGSSNVGSQGETENQSTVLKGRRVGHENLENVGHSVESDPVEDLGSGVDRDVGTSGHHGKT